MCVRFKPEVIATAAIYLAARDLNIKLPESEPHPWWGLFDTTKQGNNHVGNAQNSIH